MAANERHSTITNEHYTPAPIIEKVRTVLGKIDLDPASCFKANKYIKATTYFDKVADGFTYSWLGNVFLNPPGGWCDERGKAVIKAVGNRPGCTSTGSCGQPPGHSHVDLQSSAKAWWYKLATEWAKGHTKNAIFLAFSIELLQTAQYDGHLDPLQFPICYPKSKISFLGEDLEPGKSPTHASCIICVSRDEAMVKRFVDEFSSMGHVVVPR